MARKSSKPKKLEEPAAAYITEQRIAKEPARVEHDGPKYAAAGHFQKAAKKVFKSHSELFRKLAQ